MGEVQTTKNSGSNTNGTLGKKVKQLTASVKKTRGPGRPPGSKNKKVQKAKGPRGRKAVLAQNDALPGVDTLPIDYLLLCAKRLKEIQQAIAKLQ